MKPYICASKLWLIVLVGALGTPPAWTQNNALPSLGNSEGISLGAERQLGDRIARELYRDPDYLEDPVLDEYIQRLWAPLCAVWVTAWSKRLVNKAAMAMWSRCRTAMGIKPFMPT